MEKKEKNDRGPRASNAEGEISFFGLGFCFCYRGMREHSALGKRMLEWEWGWCTRADALGCIHSFAFPTGYYNPDLGSSFRRVRLLLFNCYLAYNKGNLVN